MNVRIRIRVRGWESVRVRVDFHQVVHKDIVFTTAILCTELQTILTPWALGVYACMCVGRGEGGHAQSARRYQSQVIVIIKCYTWDRITVRVKVREEREMQDPVSESFGDLGSLAAPSS